MLRSLGWNQAFPALYSMNCMEWPAPVSSCPLVMKSFLRMAKSIDLQPGHSNHIYVHTNAYAEHGRDTCCHIDFWLPVACKIMNTKLVLTTSVHGDLIIIIPLVPLYQRQEVEKTFADAIGMHTLEHVFSRPQGKHNTRMVVFLETEYGDSSCSWLTYRLMLNRYLRLMSSGSCLEE